MNHLAKGRRQAIIYQLNVALLAVSYLQGLLKCGQLIIGATVTIPGSQMYAAIWTSQIFREEFGTVPRRVVTEGW